MRWVRSIGAEVFGLFVDDGSFAVAILVWLALDLVLLPRLDLPPAAKCVILFAGLAAILLESAIRRARK
jgi:hypothetical protein